MTSNEVIRAKNKLCDKYFDYENVNDPCGGCPLPRYACTGFDEMVRVVFKAIEKDPSLTWSTKPQISSEITK